MTNHREATETAQDNFLDAIAKNTKAGVGQPTQIAALLRCAAFLSVAVEVTEEQWLCFARKSYEQAQAGFRADGFDVTDPDLDAPDGARVGGYERHGKRWEPVRS